VTFARALERRSCVVPHTMRPAQCPERNIKLTIC